MAKRAAKPLAVTPAAAKVDALDVRLVPIKKCAIAPENLRGDRDPEDLDAIAASIAAIGVLQPLIAYEGGGTVWITAGRRRLLGADKAGLTDVPVSIRPKADAVEASLAENVQRVKMHPADEATGYAKLLRGGKDLTTVANAFGVKPLYVKQRAALATLHTPIFEALAEDEIDLNVAEAYANAPRERQASLWKKLGPKGTSWKVRDELAHDGLDAGDRIALLVGEEAYLAAGGSIDQELFGDRGFDDEEPDEPARTWVNRPLAEKLASDRLAAEAKKLEAEGWREVIVEMKDFNTWDFETTKQPKAERGKFYAFVGIDSKGALVVKRAVVKRGSTAAKKSKAAAGGSSAAAPAMTISCHESSTRIASGVVGYGMLAKPRVALVALIAELARARFELEHTDDVGQGVLRVGIRRVSPPRGGPRPSEDVIFNPEHAPGVANLLEQVADAWWAKLDPIRGSLEDALWSWKIDDLVELLAFLLVPAVQCVEFNQISSDRAERSALATLGRLAGVKTAEFWTPTEAWFLGQSAAEIDRIWKELKGAAIKPKTKKAVALALAVAAGEADWVPQLVAEMTGAGAYVERSGKAVKS